MRQIPAHRKGTRLRGAFRLSLNILVPTILLGLLVTFVERIADRILPFLTSGWDFLWAALVVAVLFFGAVYYAYGRFSRQVSANAYGFDARKIGGRPYLICGYSPIPDKDRHGEKITTGPRNLRLADFTSDIEEAIKPEFQRDLGPWQQNLRVLHAIGRVGSLYVINPDQDQFEDFSRVIRHFLPGLEVILVTAPDRSTTFRRGYHDLGHKPDYSNFDYVTSAINRALEMIARRERMSPQEVEGRTVIDATAGFKTFSIAAAVASLNRDLLLVYARTGARTGEVIGYDVEVQLFEHEQKAG